MYEQFVNYYRSFPKAAGNCLQWMYLFLKLAIVCLASIDC
ncbi:hypothetical protein C2W64_00917 [Brevibacillus laterosporus]|nr:hypothetical protein C2W64_00917 [Brevibacillus laterosporus]